MHEIHISDVRAFKECRRRWDWSSHLRENLQSNMVYMPFFTGTLVHEVLKLYYDQNVPILEALEVVADHHLGVLEADLAPTQYEHAAQDLLDQIELVETMLSHYELWKDDGQKGVADPWKDDNLEFIAVENKIEGPIVNAHGEVADDRVHAGRLDGIVRRKDDGTYWVFETKTSSSPKQYAASLLQDEQSTSYVLTADRVLPFKITGIIYNILRKKIPAEIKPLKNGNLSQRKNADITYAWYLDAVKHHHPDWRDDQILDVYGEYLHHLILERSGTYFKRIAFTISQDQMRLFEAEFDAVSREMVDPNVAIYPAPSQVKCARCLFKDPCIALAAGHTRSSKIILNAQYKQREDRVVPYYLLKETDTNDR